MELGIKGRYIWGIHSMEKLEYLTFPKEGFDFARAYIFKAVVGQNNFFFQKGRLRFNT